MALVDVLPQTWDIDAGGITVGGVSLASLAGAYGTPLYVMDENHIRGRLRTWRDHLPAAVTVYAAKAFMCGAMADLVAEEGWWLDVVSVGEATTAERAGFPLDRVLFHGNVKTDAELQWAVTHGSRVVLDDAAEARRLAELARVEGKACEVMLRINFEVGADTHPKIRTTGVDAQFGMGADQAAQLAGELAGGPLQLVGVHTHPGSQIFDPSVYRRTADQLTGFVKSHRSLFSDQVDVNVGGGMAVPYLETDPVVPVSAYASELRRDFGERVRLMIEPGRHTVANAGLTLYRVWSRKTGPDGGQWLAVDGGMSDNPRPSLYGAELEVLSVSHAGDAEDGVFRLVGRHCETGDQLVARTDLPEATGFGDLVAVAATGAYGYSMASRYNRLPRPPVVFVADGNARVVVRGETIDDLLAHDEL